MINPTLEKLIAEYIILVDTYEYKEMKVPAALYNEIKKLISKAFTQGMIEGVKKVKVEKNDPVYKWRIIEEERAFNFCIDEHDNLKHRLITELEGKK